MVVYMKRDKMSHTCQCKPNLRVSPFFVVVTQTLRLFYVKELVPIPQYTVLVDSEFVTVDGPEGQRVTLSHVSAHKYIGIWCL